MLDTLRLPTPKPTIASWRRIALVAVCAATLAAPGGASAAPAPSTGSSSTAAASARCHATWTEVPVPNHGDPLARGIGSSGPVYSAAALFAVAALSARDVRTAGMDQVFSTPPYDWSVGVTDLERWDGTRWTRNPSASYLGQPSSAQSQLHYLAFDSPTDGWAAGWYNSEPFNPLVEHWDGTRWTISPTLSFPFLYNAGGAVTGLAAFSPTNAWITVERAHALSGPAVGGPEYGLLEHWDGTAWQFVDYPLEFSNKVPQLSALYGRAPNDIWLAATLGGPDLSEVAMHWDGATWTVIPMPLPERTQRFRIRAISGASSNDLWAVGERDGTAADGVGTHPLTEHWDGAKWTLVPAPRPSGSQVLIVNSVAVTGPSDAWAVGLAKRGTTTPPGNDEDNLILHWDGAKWTVDPGASTAPDDRSILFSVSAVSATDVWAVGGRNVPVPQLGGAFQNAVPQAYHYHCRG